MKSLNLHKQKLLAAAICLLPFTSYAADRTSSLSYGYLEADYINLDVDQPNENSIFSRDFDNGDGWGLSLSAPFGRSFFFYADYTKTKSDFTFVDNTSRVVPGDTNILRLNLGLGYAMPMSDRTDLVASAGYSDIDYDHFRLGATSSATINDLTGDTSDGYTVDLKIRSQLSQVIEGSAGARYTDIGDADGFSFIGNLMFKLTPNWALNLSVDAGDALINYGAGIRYTF